MDAYNCSKFCHGIVILLKIFFAFFNVSEQFHYDSLKKLFTCMVSRSFENVIKCVFMCEFGVAILVVRRNELAD